MTDVSPFLISLLSVDKSLILLANQTEIMRTVLLRCTILCFLVVCAGLGACTVHGVNDIQEVVSGFKDMLNANVDMSVNGTILNFAKEICVGDRLSKVQRHIPTLSDSTICGYTTVVQLVTCIFEKAIENHLRDCRRAMEQNSASVRSGYCAAFITFLELISGFTRSGLDSKYCWRYGEFFNVEHYLDLGLELVRSCHLEDSARTERCPSILDSLSNDGIAQLNYHNQAISRSVLALASASSDGLGHVNLSTMCWEAELQKSAELYRRARYMDVDKKCVATLQTMSVSMIREFILIHEGILRWPDDRFLRLLKYTGGLDVWLPRIIRLFPSFVKENSDWILQLTLYPSFKRFLRHANLPHGDNSSAVNVSCRGLRGSRSEIHTTVVQLLRLVIINELHHFNFSLLPTLAGVYCNHFLPCFVDRVLA